MAAKEDPQRAVRFVHPLRRHRHLRGLPVSTLPAGPVHERGPSVADCAWEPLYTEPRLGASVTENAAGGAAGVKKFEGPITIEQSFKVDGKKLTVLVTFPGQVVAEFGMEGLLTAANRAVVSVESKAHKVEKFKP